MFQDDRLDVLTRTPWWAVAILWVPIIAGLIGQGLAAGQLGVGSSVALVLAGWLTWTLAEYLLHRFFFHWIPDTSWGPTMHFWFHGVHHDWHQDPYRLVMPPAVGLGFGLIFGTLWWNLLGSTLFFPFMGGFALGYLAYDMVHYATHHAKFANPVFLAVKKHHLLHHHSPAHKDRKFGVSSPIWDWVFRTA
jgi:sterol desaturase/sphingolipid hydroxylase (fatty acid hydroxylase superfamily)